VEKKRKKCTVYTPEKIEKEQHGNGQKMYECMALKCVVDEREYTSRM
jgi:hypothetical protein